MALFLVLRMRWAVRSHWRGSEVSFGPFLHLARVVVVIPAYFTFRMLWDIREHMATSFRFGIVGSLRPN